MRASLTLIRVCAAVLLFFRIGPAFSQQTLTGPLTPEDRSKKFRLEVTPVANGAELLTIWGKSNALSETMDREIPLLSVLRDTLGDANPDNDLLRQVWVHTYTRPRLKQRVAAFVPFLYKGISKDLPKTGTPPAIIDLSDTETEVWKRVFRSSLTTFAPFNQLAKAATHTYQHNIDSYRAAKVIRAVTVLNSYQQTKSSSSELSQHELEEMQSRLMLSLRTFGGLVDEKNFQRFYKQETARARDFRGHNYELLRQQAEAAGLYFEPLKMPDGSVTHAVLWIARSDLSQPEKHRYEGRFLNLKNPWEDQHLRQWSGYTEDRYFSSENREVFPGTSGARTTEMIPLAAYGLDFPKIPTLLVDFRAELNPKKREISRRLIDDVARNVLSISKFGNIYYGTGRTAFDLVTGRRGIDFNQPSRAGSLAQLKLLLSLDSDLSPSFRKLMSEKLDRLSSNPLETAGEQEQNLACNQFERLRTYALSTDGLPAQLKRDRAKEMARFVHGPKTRSFFRLANVLTLGMYTHREKITLEQLAHLDIQRSLAYHTRFLRETAKASPDIEVTANMEEVHRSLIYIAQNGSLAGNNSVRAMVKVFNSTADIETRQLCLRALKMIGSKAATRELAQITKDERMDLSWRQLSEQYLNTLTVEKEKARPTGLSGNN